MHILIWAPVGRTAEVVRDAIDGAGLAAVTCPDLDAFADAIREGAGAAVLLGEAVAHRAAAERVLAALESQPPWSALPLHVFVRRDRPVPAGVRVLRRETGVGCVTLIERPVRPEALVTSLEAALRSRLRQYRLRNTNASLEARVEARTRQVRKLSRALTLAEQVERQRIAHVLHDDLQQLLFGAQIAATMGDSDQLQAVLDEAMTLTRTLSHELSPPLVNGEDLADLLHWLAERKQELHGLAVEVEVADGVSVPTADLRVLLYQLLRELLFNVVKHAETDRARVVAERTDHHVRLVVEDEGVGFAPDDLEEAGGVGLGLSSIRERLELIGGEVDVESVKGEGTRVALTVPVSEEVAGG
jgi:signal transduction histidine kinase